MAEGGGQPAPTLQPNPPPMAPNRASEAPPQAGEVTRPAVGNDTGNGPASVPEAPPTANARAVGGAAAAGSTLEPIAPFLSQEEVNRRKEATKVTSAAKADTPLEVIPGHKASILSVGEFVFFFFFPNIIAILSLQYPPHDRSERKEWGFNVSCLGSKRIEPTRTGVPCEPPYTRVIVYVEKVANVGWVPGSNRR